MCSPHTVRAREQHSPCPAQAMPCLLRRKPIAGKILPLPTEPSCRAGHCSNRILNWDADRVLTRGVRSDQLFDRLHARIDQILRAAAEVEEAGGSVEVDAEVAVERGVDLFEGDGAVGRFAAVAGGCADRLTGL